MLTGWLFWIIGSLAGSNPPSSSILNFSRSSASLTQQPTTLPSSSSNSSLSFLSSVMSKGRSSAVQGTGKIISKKLFRQRSKSQGRATGPQVTSPWTPSIQGDPKVSSNHSFHTVFRFFVTPLSRLKKYLLVLLCVLQFHGHIQLLRPKEIPGPNRPLLIGDLGMPGVETLSLNFHLIPSSPKWTITKEDCVTTGINYVWEYVWEIFDISNFKAFYSSLIGFFHLICWREQLENSLHISQLSPQSTLDIKTVDSFCLKLCGKYSGWNRYSSHNMGYQMLMRWSVGKCHGHLASLVSLLGRGEAQTLHIGWIFWESPKSLWPPPPW